MNILRQIEEGKWCLDLRDDNGHCYKQMYFQIGDTVKITGTSYYHPFKVGDTVYVHAINTKRDNGFTISSAAGTLIEDGLCTIATEERCYFEPMLKVSLTECDVYSNATEPVEEGVYSNATEPVEEGVYSNATEPTDKTQNINMAMVDLDDEFRKDIIIFLIENGYNMTVVGGVIKAEKER